jgi:hypothetical protein
MQSNKTPLFRTSYRAKRLPYFALYTKQYHLFILHLIQSNTISLIYTVYKAIPSLYFSLHTKQYHLFILHFIQSNTTSLFCTLYKAIPSLYFALYTKQYHLFILHLIQVWTCNVTLHVHTCSGRNRIIALMRRPNTDSTPKKPVTLPRIKRLLRYAVPSPVHTVTIRCYDTR